MTKILRCTCSNSYQDNKYGSKMRIHNSRGAETVHFRCTVCKAERSKDEGSSSASKTAKKK